MKVCQSIEVVIVSTMEVLLMPSVSVMLSWPEEDGLYTECLLRG